MKNCGWVLTCGLLVCTAVCCALKAYDQSAAADRWHGAAGMIARDRDEARTGLNKLIDKYEVQRVRVGRLEAELNWAREELGRLRAEQRKRPEPKQTARLPDEPVRQPVVWWYPAKDGK